MHGLFAPWTIVAACTTILLWTGVGYAAERKLADRQPFSASVLADFTCRRDITVTVRAPDEAAFTSNRVELQKLIGGLRAILGFECPNTPITNLVVVGEAGGKEVYRGSASASSNWLLADLRSATTFAPPGQAILLSVPEKVTVPKHNLIQNGSFESGVNIPDNPGYLPLNPGSTAINNWAVIRGGIDYYGAGWVASDGRRSLDLNGTPGVGGVAQKFATTPGQKYRVSFDMAGHHSGLLQTMRVGAAGQSHAFEFQSRTDPHNLGWEHRTWDFTANEYQTTLEFYSLQKGYPFGGPALDNVYVAMVKEGLGVSRKPEGKAPNLIVLVHGCCTDENGVKEWDELGTAISDKSKPKHDWEIVVLDWHASTPVPPDWQSWMVATLTYVNIAYDAAYNEGYLLANDIIRTNHAYKYIHFIGHSAGAKLIQDAATALILNEQIQHKKPFIHLTFLDAYTRTAEDSGEQGEAGYGYLKGYPGHYAEHYVDIGEFPGTDAILKQAFNFDVTHWEDEKTSELFEAGHQWPRRWYTRSIQSPNRTGNLVGFKLSLEAGNTKYNTLTQRYPAGDRCQITNVASAALCEDIIFPTLYQ